MAMMTNLAVPKNSWRISSHSGHHDDYGKPCYNDDKYVMVTLMKALHGLAISCAGLSSTESRSTVVYCVRTEFGRHYRYIANKGTGDDGMCC